MMWWNGGWTWVAMGSMMLLMWALIALVLVPFLRSGREQLATPRERLDERLATGEISVDEHRARRSELEHRS